MRTLFFIICALVCVSVGAQQYANAESIKAKIEKGLADSKADTTTTVKKSRRASKYVIYRENEPSLRKIRKSIDPKDVDIYIHTLALQQDTSLCNQSSLDRRCTELINIMRDTLVRNDLINCYYYAIHKDPKTGMYFALIRDQEETIFFIADSSWKSVPERVMRMRNGHPGYYDLSKSMCYHLNSYNKWGLQVVKEFFFPYVVTPYVEKKEQ